MQYSVRWGLISLLLATACGTDEPAASLGSSAPLVPAQASLAPALALDSAPEYLLTGSLFQGDSVHFFGVSNASFLPNGRTVIALGRNQNQIVLLGENGQVTQVLGGRGGGPQEFRGVPTLMRAGDRLFAFSGRSYVEVTKEGLGEPVSYQSQVRQQVLGVFADRSWVSTPHPTLRWGGPDGGTKGLDSTPYYVWSEGTVVDSLNGPASPPEPAYALEPAPFLAHGQCLPELLHTVVDSVLVIAQASTGLLMALGRSGVLDTLYQSPDRGVVTREMVDGARSLAVNEGLVAPGSREPFLERVGEAGDPLESVWSHMLFDGDRLVWLRRASPCLFGGKTDDPSLWELVDIRSRSRVAVVEVPARLRVLAVSPGRVLSVERDEFDVERVGLYRMANRELRR